ncbi:MAG: FGGY-family carbohydrate kinase [Bacteroidetes bacterium]|nr:FGGY-family carbohydrate kinase [Bacteroidota bacterium]
MKYVLGYDLGTSYFKAAVVDETGKVLGLGRVRTPKRVDGTIVTITPADFWDALKECTSIALGNASIASSEICGISYGSQANSFILLDESKQPLNDIVVWPTEYTDAIDPKMAAYWNNQEYLRITGQGYTGNGFALAKLLWLQKQQPEMWEKVHHFLTISDYFIYGLTGARVTDTGTSALLGCLDVLKGCFWKEGLVSLGLNPEIFAEVLSMGEFCGSTISGGSQRLGLDVGIPVFAGGLDHVVAAIGAGLGTVAEVSESTGTVLACIAFQPGYSPQPAVSIGSPIRKGEYSYLSFHDPGAEVIEDYHERYFPKLSIDEMLALVQSSTPGSSGLQYLDVMNDSEMLDRFVGGSGLETHEKGDYIRAITENIANRIRKLSQAVSGGQEVRRIVATGGANRSVDLLQVKADMFFTEVVSCKEKELGTFGAAMIAALGCRWFDDIKSAQESWVQVEWRVQPDYQQYREYQSWITDRERR